MKSTLTLIVLLLTVLTGCQQSPHTPAGSHQDLLNFFQEWRAFEKPAVTEDIPNYSHKAMQNQARQIPDFLTRLEAIDTTGWSIPHRVDWEIVRAEIKGLEFNHKVLRPWFSNPLFYTVIEMDEADVPDREWPEMITVLNVFNHEFPLNDDSRAVFRKKLGAIPATLEQAKTNLTEMTDYFVDFGLDAKAAELEALNALPAMMNDAELAGLAQEAAESVQDFILWLQSKHDDAPPFRGIGKAAYNRYMKEVHLVPYDWDAQMTLLERELERSLAGLSMEEQRNRNLPPLTLPASLEELNGRIDTAIDEFLTFLDENEIMTVPDYMHLEWPMSRYIPEEKLDFFWHILYRDPMPLICHQIHWMEKQREARNTHPIRRPYLLSKIWDSRAEGLATGFEELMMQAGLMKDRHRARELNYIMLAFRAVRAIGALKLHANEWTLDEAMAWGSANTPRGYAGAESGMLFGDYALYLSQPGYGSSYVIGKIQLDHLIADRRRQMGQDFVLKAFFDDYFSRGVIPASLLRWEMTGLDDEMKQMRD